MKYFVDELVAPADSESELTEDPSISHSIYRSSREYELSSPAT